MYNSQTTKVISSFEDSFDVLSSLESLIKATQNSCLNKECFSIYYNLSSKEKFTLSEERNHYINLLTIALDKVSSLKEIYVAIEKELSYLK